MENEAEEDSKSFKYIPQKPEESPEAENVQMNWNVCLAKIITAYKLIKTENKQENTGNNKSCTLSMVELMISIISNSNWKIGICNT